ncbi:MAG TPA: hypothetical protein VN442_24795 [Bryobacteraceae bacterium]|nr:hypothetical protein [Bryobacteraceae bacterium]
MKGCLKVLFLLACLHAGRAAAETPEAAARDLARAVFAAVEADPAALSIRNLSSLPAAGFAEVRAAVMAALRAQGVRLAENGAAEVRVTASENLRNWLLVAEVRRGETRTVLMTAWPRTPAASAPLTAVWLERRLVWEQDEPILDFVIVEGEPERRLFVLEPSRVAVYGRTAAGWEPRGSFAVAAAPGRDLRGRLAVQGNAFQAWLPGSACRGTIDPPALECTAGEALWPLASGGSLAGHATFRAGHNAFEGTVFTPSGAKATVPPFYSMALAGSPEAPLWVMTSLDGRAVVYNASFSPAGQPISGWGGDVAGVEASCGAGRQVLVSRPGDAQEPDAVEAWEVGLNSAAPVSPPLEFSGPVTALWPSGATSASAVVRDPSTGRYAAYRLAIGCGS